MEPRCLAGASRTVACAGANVIAMRTNAIDMRQTVIVQGGRIAGIGAEATTPGPDGAYVVDAHDSMRVVLGEGWSAIEIEATVQRRRGEWIPRVVLSR